MLLASLLVGTVLLFSSRKSGLYTVGERERVQSGTIGTRVERAQLSRAANSQSKCVLAAGGGCAPRAQESRREREGEYLERAMCIFQIFKVDSWLAFFGHAKIFSCSPLSLVPAASFSLFVACTLPAIPVKFPSRTSRNLSEKKTRNSTHYPKMPGDGTRTRRRTMHYLANDLCCWIAKYLLVPFH